MRRQKAEGFYEGRYWKGSMNFSPRTESPLPVTFQLKKLAMKAGWEYQVYPRDANELTLP